MSEELKVSRPLVDYAARNVGKGNTIISPLGNKEQLALNFARDMGRAYEHLLREAVNQTFLQVVGDEKKEEYVDYICKAMVVLHNAYREDNIKGLDLFRQLHEYFQSEGEAAQEVYVIYTIHFHQLFHAYMFSSAHTAMGIVNIRDEDSYTMAVNMLAMTEKGDKQKLLKILRKNMTWPGNINPATYVQSMEPFMEMAKADREWIKAKNKSTKKDTDETSVK